MGGKKGGERGSSEKRVSGELVSGLESCLVENETRGGAQGTVCSCERKCKHK